ncbi:6-bladed beta-propeller [Gracilimonas sp.]|uniref:6-bladed beta-propeller n=1 Tax=Gracilimonas sp. TaxID=1974203 RepID=UPI0028711077|nr:6-bladed beta-propeller [Gracilimonas sp.]
MRILKKAFLLIFLFLGCSGEEVQEKKEVDEELNEINQSDTEYPEDDSSNSNVSIKKIAFEEEYRFDFSDEVLVSYIATIAVDDQKRLFVADIDQATVHVFRPEGDYLTSLGQRGRGPGEFSAITPNTFMKIHSNRIYITDGSYQVRAHVYQLNDLSFSHTMKLIPENQDDYKELEGYYPRRIFPLNDGVFLVAYHQLRGEYKDATSFIRYMTQDSTGVIVSGPILEQKDLTNSVYRYPNGNTGMTTFPFYSKSLLTVSEESYIYAVNNTEEFEIDIHSTDGKHIHTFQHPFENILFNKNKVMNRYERTNYLSQLGEGVALKMIREADNLPETWPALEDMFVDDENNLWVSTIVEDFEIYEWWVLEESGEVIAKFEWPRDKPIEVIRNGYIYTRETNEKTGIEEVVRYRIELEEL